MYLNRKDIDKIKDILDKFENIQSFELNQSRHSGIGSVTEMSFEHEINEVRTKVTVEISGVENW